MSTDRRTRTREYNRRLAELENFITDNRLVSKEAQMSSLSGEGYKDPRFTVSFDNPLIDKFGLFPLAAEGSGYQPSTAELGMSGADSILQRTIGGQYNPKTDVLTFKNPKKYNAVAPPTVENIQKHELVHRAVQNSGYLDFLPTSEFLKENATTKYLKGRLAEYLEPLINEVLAESYEDTDDLENRIRFRVSRFAIKDDMKKIVADEMIENVDVLKQDFENYLKSISNPDEVRATRTDELAVEME